MERVTVARNRIEGRILVPAGADPTEAAIADHTRDTLGLYYIEPDALRPLLKTLAKKHWSSRVRERANEALVFRRVPGDRLRGHRPPRKVGDDEYERCSADELLHNTRFSPIKGRSSKCERGWSRRRILIRLLTMTLRYLRFDW